TRSCAPAPTGGLQRSMAAISTSILIRSASIATHRAPCNWSRLRTRRLPAAAFSLHRRPGPRAEPGIGPVCPFVCSSVHSPDNKTGDHPMALHDIVSPLPGTFYRRASPEAAPYAEVGTSTDNGAVVGLVEVMKQFSDVE